MRAVFIATAVYSLEGGLERFNQRVVRALAELRESGFLDRVSVVAQLDLPEHAARAPAGVRFVAGRSSKLRTSAAFTSLVFRERAELILYGHIGFAPLVLIGRLLRRSAAHSLIVHGVEVWRPPTWVRRFAVRRLLDQVIAVSRFTARRMSTYFRISEDRFCLLPNALDLGGGGPPSPKAPELALQGRWRLLTVSRLSPVDRYKNVDKVIQALPLILSKHPETHYYVVGDGTWRPALEALTRECGVEQRVHFLGKVDDATRDAAYAGSHVFVLPSTGEGFGIVFLEAWRHTLPVVASDQDAAREVIRHGTDGFCVEPRPEAIAEAVCELLGDPGLRARMGEAGRRRLEDHYTHARFRETLRKILRERGPCAA